MRKKLIVAMMAGVLSAGMFSTGVFAADTDLKGEVNTFIAASLSNAMEEIQKDFNETYPDVEILYNADSSGTLQTQIEEGARCDLFFSAADKQMNALVDENLAKKDTVEDILENKVVLIKPKDGEEIQKDFNETYPDVEILYNADSSGTLQTQIEEGARCDIFFSAADKQMNALIDENLAKKDTVEDILENKVVLIKPKDGETKVTGFENITDAANIALAGDSVPVGQYSREIFDNLGITDEVNKMEINEGKNVSEVLAAVSEGSNEIGIVYATDAASVADKVDVIAEAPADALKTPVRYPVGLIEDKEASEDDTAAAEAFLEYIKSDDAMKVFEKYGFTAYKADDASETDDKDAETTEETDDTETNAETETTEEAK